jgi:VanZ family protein
MNKFMSKIYFSIKYVVPVFVLTGIIFYLSDQPNLGSWMVNPLESFPRKGAHFTEYGLLAFLLWRLFYSGWRFFPGVSFLFSLSLTTLYAVSDEFHQSFVQGRNGSEIDIIIDFFSAFVILQVVLFFLKRKMRQSVIKNVVLMGIGIVILGGIVGSIAWRSYEDSGVTSSGVSRYVDNSNAEDSNNIDSNNIDNNNIDSVIIENEGLIVKEENIEEAPLIENKDNDKLLPRKVKHKVSFITQSPFAKWDELHEEACEEASLIMLKYYSSGENLNKDIAEDEIQKLVKYQMEKYGNFYDTDVKTNKEIGEEYFELKGLRIIKDFKIIDLKRELADGNIILIPTAGRELKNPYFSGAGPLYHNLVIIGYDDKKNIFITNDPGTRRGKNYKYNQQVLYDAIHDFPGDVNKILEGGKRALVLTR